MKRTFNYTGRIRLEKQDIEIQLRSADGIIQAEGRIRFEDPGRFGPNSNTILYFRKGAIRRAISAGPVRPELRFSEKLPEFPDADGIRLDVRVVDRSDPAMRLLGLARGVRSASGDDDGRKSLLPARLGDFSVPLWRVRWDSNDGACLEFSKRCADFRKVARSDEFLALVLPCAVRQIAAMIIDQEVPERESDDEDDPAVHWRGFLEGLPDVDELEDDMDDIHKERWLDQVEAAFARQSGVLGRAAKLLAITDEEAD